MASIIPGFEYDIFISYRHKDDKYDHWVTDFVSNLRRELEATLRDEISVYFDSNKSDGLLATHDVDESLKHKLKCLVFIPVISHTYCDSSSFAWVNEFKAFVELASSDNYGLKVRLPNGNYASRVLPVLIHDLPDEEKILCEKVLGSKLRGIEFIYSEPGVNRPLRVNEDNPHNNLSKTIYRNQINKLANSVKEIINAISHKSLSSGVIDEDRVIEKKPVKKTMKVNWKILTASVVVLVLVMAGYFFVSTNSETNVPVEKSVAVLPFMNLGDPGKNYFGEGMRVEILDNLFMIDSLNIPETRTISNIYKQTLSNKEIARKLNVTFLLSGDYKISESNVSITVRIYNAKEDKTTWTEKYNRKLHVKDYIEIQSEIAQEVATKLQVTLELPLLERMSILPTSNNDAYSLYLKAIDARFKDSESAMKMLQEAISIDSTFAQAYADLAIHWILGGGHGGTFSRKEVLENAEPLIKTALRLDHNLLNAHGANALINLLYYQNFKSVNDEYNAVKRLHPSNTEAISWFSDYLLAAGKSEDALIIRRRALAQNQSVSYNWEYLALAYSFNNQKEKAVETILKAVELFRGHSTMNLNAIRILTYSGKYKEAVELYNKEYHIENSENNVPWLKGLLGYASYKLGDEVTAKKYLNELLIQSERSPNGSPSIFAAYIYAAMDDKDKAIRMLEKAYDTKEVELYWIKADPLFNTLHGDPRFTDLLMKIGF